MYSRGLGGTKNPKINHPYTLNVMKEENIPIIDVYIPLTKHLDWASGDCYHWKNPAYKFISQEIEKRLEN